VVACAPDAELRGAAALVFVEDLNAPVLSLEDSHHLCDVLRLKPGEVVATADGAGSFRMCAFTGPVLARKGPGSRKNVGCGLEATGPVKSMAKPLPLVEVGFSWAKAERTEWAVAKLVELGVNVLTPLVADRTVVRPDREQAARRSERLRRIIREAAMQSRRPFLPEIGASCSVDEMARRDTPVALAEPGGSPVSLATPVVCVGPEGGWSVRELALVEAKVTLGDGVLRVETAALVAGSLLCALRATAVAVSH